MATSGVMSTALANKLINHVLRNTPYYTSGCVYVGLYTQSPGDDNSGTEISGSNYARAAAFSGTGIFTVSGSYAYNSASIIFTEAVGNWGTISHFGLLSASQSGSLLFYGEIGANTRTVNDGDILRFIPGKMVLYSTGAMLPSLSGSILNFVLNNISYTSPGSSLYAGLFAQGTYTIQTVGTELSGSSLGYSRMPIGGSPFWAVPTEGSAIISSSVVFTTSASEYWGNIIMLGIFNTPTGGSPLFISSAFPAREVRQYDGFYLASGAVSVPFDLRPPSAAITI